jgi:hypothetical protein
LTKKKYNVNSILTFYIGSARAKFLRAKRMATSGDDKTHLNAILGVKSTVTQVADGSSTTYMTAFSI